MSRWSEILTKFSVRVMSWGRILACGGIVACLAGCGGVSDQPELGTVTGLVTLDGDPLPGATVKFVPESGRSSVGITDATGRYELQYTNDTPGAKVGPHIVSISTMTAGYSDEGGSSVESSAEKIPKRYNEGSTLQETVEAGENVIDFPLTSDGEISSTSSE